MIASQSELLPAVYSTATADSVAAFVAANYDLPAPLECILLQRGFNDSFPVRVAEWGTASMTWLGQQEEFLRAWEAEKLSPSLLG